MSNLEIRNLTRRKAPAFAFKKALDRVLPGWDISLVFVGPKKAKELNIALRKKSYVPNVLSYQVGRQSGEIIICLAVAEKQASSYGLLPAAYYLFLFIHALMHLKGMRHGSTMEKAERQALGRIPLLHPNETTHRNRNRHRHAPDKGRRR